MATCITTNEQLDVLVARVVELVPSTERQEFLGKCYSKFDKASGTNAYLEVQAGRVYLPYPFNNKFVAGIMNDPVTNKWGV